jgi:hypothetical protein
MKKNDHLSESAFALHESKLTGIDGHGSGYQVDFHGPAKTPVVGKTPLSPGRQASVDKAAAASVAKRRAVAAMKPRRGIGF